MLKVLLIAEGSGGHLIPALEVASVLAQGGARIKLWYAQRSTMAPLADALTHQMIGRADRAGSASNDERLASAPDAAIDIDPFPVEASTNPLERLWKCGQLWQRAQRCFDAFAPDVVVGFGGWVSAPVLLAACLRRYSIWPWDGRQARARHIRCVLHEQNVVMGRANRWLAPWMDRVAISFPETRARAARSTAVTTGLPIRPTIGSSSRAEGAERFGLDPDRPTVLVLGGSQGARAINHLMIGAAGLLTSNERSVWQVLHLTGGADEDAVRQAYATHDVRARVLPFSTEMDAAYAQADLVIARAGASTIAELARCGIPAILIPYPHAGGHQRANAKLVEAVGGGMRIEEAEASPQVLLAAVRRLLNDRRLRGMMGLHMCRLGRADAAERLREAILDVARPRTAQDR